MKVGKDTKIWHKEKSVIGACKIGDDCVIHAPVWIGDDVRIGNNCKIQAFAFLPTGVTIKNNVFVGPSVCFINDKHPPSGRWEKITIEDDVSIGAGAIIMPGANIGKSAVIGAGAIVLKPVMPKAVIISKLARGFEQHPR